MRGDERIFRAALDQAGLPQPVRELRFAPPRRWRFDWCWPAQRVALETEGGIWIQGRHVRGRGVLNDMAKYNEAAILGYCLLRCTPSQLCGRGTLDLIRRALARLEA